MCAALKRARAEHNGMQCDSTGNKAEDKEDGSWPSFLEVSNQNTDTRRKRKCRYNFVIKLQWPSYVSSSFFIGGLGALGVVIRYIWKVSSCRKSAYTKVILWLHVRKNGGYHQSFPISGHNKPLQWNSNSTSTSYLFTYYLFTMYLITTYLSLHSALWNLPSQKECL